MGFFLIEKGSVSGCVSVRGVFLRGRGCGCRENKKVSLIKQKLDLLKGSTKVKKLGEKSKSSHQKVAAINKSDREIFENHNLGKRDCDHEKSHQYLFENHPIIFKTLPTK